MNPKPGIKTTEFWLAAILALVGPIVTILVGGGVIAPEHADAVVQNVTSNTTSITQAVVVIVANITSLLSVRAYTQARTEAKAAPPAK